MLPEIKKDDNKNMYVFKYGEKEPEPTGGCHFRGDLAGSEMKTAEKKGEKNGKEI